MAEKTLAWFMDQAISWETAARELYLTLSESFPSHPPVQAFWRRLAIDESAHTALIDRARESIAPAQLQRPLSQQTLQLVSSVEATLRNALVERPATLGEAYDIAHRIESSEINSVFRIVAMNSIDDHDRYELMDKQFAEHVQGLIDFGREYDQERRDSITLDASVWTRQRALTDQGDDVRIVEATDSDLSDVLAVERVAFNEDSEAELVEALLSDPTARPLLSLIAKEGDRTLGHILFTTAQLQESPREVSIALLAPLAIAPEAQRRGIGGKLIARGLELLAESGVDLVFVLGHPEYYPRHGFEPAGRLGLTAPYPIPEKDSGAWMVQELRPGILGTVSGTVAIADALDRPEYWRE